MTNQTRETAAAADSINQISPIPESVAAVVHLYHEQLSGVAFPGVDASALAAAAADVDHAEAAELAAREALARARAALAERDDALYQLAQRALAYARVYAEGQPALAQLVDAISLRRRRVRAKSSLVADGESDDVASKAATHATKRGRRRRAKSEIDDDDTGEQASLLRAI